MVAKAKDMLLLPALRGGMGDWIYYSCLIPAAELARRVDYAAHIHESKALSDLIQRSLEGSRAKSVSSYLEKTPQRFFNSLVLATYGGKPKWLEVGNLHSETSAAVLQATDPQALESFGFLSLSGNEKIFAVDGQHRLAGIKKAIGDGFDFGGERLAVIFIGHNEKERERTRRLFTTLNKTAKPVAKADIIALDEDDSMAIIARRLVESHLWFKEPKILVSSSTSLPVTNRIALTNIVNLYDILKLVFKFKDELKKDESLRFYRPSDVRLDDLEAYAVKFFGSLAKAFAPVKELFSAKDNEAAITHKYRSSSGGHLLFRPAGLEIFTRLAISYATRHGLTLFQAIDALKNVPTELSARPYRDIIWNPEKRTMVLAGRKLARDLLDYMVGLTDVKDDALLERYRLATGDEALKLPRRLPKPPGRS
ncbi:DGQHR domain-containing protein [Luteimonas fraxinea]|uniref:DGQHR domain-containing protein n=1 Tax=Luteimonas fraxinea TaxID=2901869 RepID=UPI001E286B2A|nr:DGQHR domain-containing protein [Luteimonas fraxinea]UHH10126.1 DGQHR domain-containing protein [Luteimonas fraxinea]